MDLPSHRSIQCRTEDTAHIASGMHCVIPVGTSVGTAARRNMRCNDYAKGVSQLKQNASQMDERPWILKRTVIEYAIRLLSPGPASRG